jgi:glycosyl transferase family 25
MDKTRAYVINLARSIERRRHIEEQLAAAGLQARFIEAVDGRELTEEQMQRYVDPHIRAAYPEWLGRPTMIGCGLSHRRAWQQIVDDGQPAGLVLEDDAVFDPGLGAFLGDLLVRVRLSEAVLLSYRAWGRLDLSRRQAASLAGDRGLYLPVDSSGLSSTTAYVIGSDACQRLYEGLLPMRHGPDSWGAFIEEGWLDQVRCVYPQPVRENLHFKSSIDYLAQGTLPGRLSTWASGRRVPGFSNATAWLRRRRERRAMSIRIVDEPPIPDVRDNSARRS